MQRFVVVFFLVAVQVISNVAAKRIFPVPKFSSDDFMKQPGAMEKRAICTEEEKDKKSNCGKWKSNGFCESGNKYYKFMMKNCKASCGECIINQDCLKAHNAKRALHGAEPLVWDATLAEHAKVWADHLVELGKMEHSKGSGESENLFAGSQSPVGKVYSCEQAVESWYSEVKDYNYDKPTSNVEENLKTGHFTQVVWKGTTKVGVALATTVVVKGGRPFTKTYIVARYSPPGNMLGQFFQNVGRITA